MKKLIFFSILALSLPAFANPAYQPMEIKTLAMPLPANTVAREHSSQKDMPIRPIFPKHLTDYPTQVVRLQGELKGPPQSCDTVFQKIDAFYTNHITYDKFFYNTIIYCSYDPDTQFAISFMINSYFDPLDDNAIAYLQKYLVKHNGRNLLGYPFYVENSKGMIVSMNIDVGMEDPESFDTLLRYEHDNDSYYYTNNYNMLSDLVTDIYQRFYTNDPEIILPFIDKWFLTSQLLYERVLKKSDYAELQPELVFLMDKAPAIFTPKLRLYYGHHCSQYENKHCL